MSERDRDRRPITAGTVVCGVIGDPVGHSLSPLLHNAAFAAMGLDWVYAAFPVAGGSGAEAVQAMRTLGIRGLSVTMPHKQAASAAADERSASAAALGAANTLTLAADGSVRADNTDGAGFLAALSRELGFEVAGRRVALIGAGGAARALIVAVAAAGAEEVVVLNRSAERAEAAAALAGPLGRVGGVADLASADLVVNATPVGMAESPGAAAPAGAVGRSQTAVDLIYRPARTVWLDDCEANGAAVLNGLGMLVHQAAEQIALWTGRQPPVETMAESLRTARIS